MERMEREMTVLQSEMQRLRLVLGAESFEFEGSPSTTAPSEGEMLELDLPAATGAFAGAAADDASLEAMPMPRFVVGRPGTMSVHGDSEPRSL